MLKNLKLSTKLWGLTALLLVAVLFVAGNSIWSISGILFANNQYSDAAGNKTFMVEKEVDHLNWINKVKDLFAQNLETLTVQVDHTKCGLGKFLHGEQGKALAESDSKLASSLESIKEPHRHLHESAQHIKDEWRQVHTGLSLTLAARLDDHRRWAASVANSLLQNKEVKVEVNPTRCGFGKWLAGEECRKLVATWPEFAAIISKVTEHHDRLHQSAEKIKRAAKPEEKQKIYAEETAQELLQVATLFGNAQEREADLIKAQDAAQHVFESETLPALTATQDKMKALIGQLDNHEKSSKAEMASTGSKSQWTAGVITGLAFVVGVLVSFFMIRSITKPINHVIGELSEGADQVASASGQVSSSSQSLAEGTAEQAASLEETSSSLEEMASMTKQNADNASQADNLMKEANQVVVKANDSMTELTTSMEEISKASEETSKIIKTIDEIAFQTNLLALNAAVEAARAGEAGAGFAVVADEVRNLAMRAADAAKNTADLIEGTVKKVKDGSELVTSTNEAFTEVATSAGKVGELVGEIAAASNEQSQGIEQVNKAMGEMDKVVQSAAANAEESASASEEMNAQAEQMKGNVQALVAIVGGSSGADGQTAQHAVGTTLNTVAAGAGNVIRKAVAAPKKARTQQVAAHVATPPAKEVKPEEVIPMDESEFKDF